MLITKLKRDNKRTSTGAKIESEQQTSVEAKLILHNSIFKMKNGSAPVDFLEDKSVSFIMTK